MTSPSTNRSMGPEPSTPVAQILLQPVLLQQFAAKVGALRETLDDDTIRAEACEALDVLIESAPTTLKRAMVRQQKWWQTSRILRRMP
ncbi:hypothetical protein ABVV53_17250 [Novosphingobium sp. RD2P27]|uniref:HEAT repeat protein n=1 Tax=Novosphingobium kalidii TaxID=3230299 RepID=A0ABV2D243_9SPHN